MGAVSFLFTAMMHSESCIPALCWIFAKLEYKKEAYVVCRKNNLARQLFSQDFNVDRILRGLRAMTSVDITPVSYTHLALLHDYELLDRTMFPLFLL